MTEWQPITTAPKDEIIDIWVKSTHTGSQFRYPDIKWAVCYYTNERAWCVLEPDFDERHKDVWSDVTKIHASYGSPVAWVVTHWQPLPDPPGDE